MGVSRFTLVSHERRRAFHVLRSAALGWPARLDEICRTHGLGDDQRARLARLLELVRDDETAPTAVRDPERAVDVHVADSLAALGLDVVRTARTLADVGSGAGFPGLPLAVALPEARVTLIESAGRKCAFLERGVAAAGATNAAVACARVEEWPGRELDVVCARALAPLAVLVEYAAPLLRLGGRLVAWKGRPDRAEGRAGAAAAAQIGLRAEPVVALEPLPGAQHRTLYLYLKASETPPQFPRRAGMARKRPLSG